MRSSLFASTELVRPSKIRLGIVGCGRVAEQCQIPAALSTASMELSAIADADPTRLDYVTGSFGLSCIATSSHTSLIGIVDAVLILLPNHLHCPVACDFINSGIHVLCEKPLAP